MPGSSPLPEAVNRSAGRRTTDAAVVITDPDRFLDIGDEDFAVSDFAGARRPR